MPLTWRYYLLLLLSTLPGLAAATLLVLRSGREQWTSLILLGATVACGIGIPFVVLRALRQRLDGVANVLGAIRAGDYSLRVRTRTEGDLTASMAREVNELREALSGERVGELRAAALTRSIVNSVSVPIVVFDADDRLRLLNPAAAHLIGVPAVRALGQHAISLEFSAILDQLGRAPGASDGAPRSQVIRHAFGRRRGTWDVQYAVVGTRDDRQTVLLLTDLTQALNVEQRLAWDRLIRVLSHELNNSLASIQSLARSVARRTGNARGVDVQQYDPSVSVGDLAEMIADRATSLSAFLGAFAHQQQLPAPIIAPLEIGALVEHAKRVLESDLLIVEAGASIVLSGDTAQLEQVLINVMRNGIEAATGHGVVRLWWYETTIPNAHGAVDGVRIVIVDDGLGITNAENLFVPFFSTKAGGSGVGLALARRIVEAHGGTVTLENRVDGRGARLEITLPLMQGCR